MRCEAEITAALQAGEAELRCLCDDISRLDQEVKLRGAGWRDAAESLHACMERKRALNAQLDLLRWVLSGEYERVPV
jgi:hypothetical protein